jgi:phosphotriesterase-related protein
VHAQNEKNWDHYLEAAMMGAWVSLDGVQQDNVDQYIERLVRIKNQALLHKVLISQDAGWFDPDKQWNGPKRKYTDIHNYLLPGLKAEGFSNKQIKQLMEINPREAYTIRVRKL